MSGIEIIIEFYDFTFVGSVQRNQIEMPVMTLTDSRLFGNRFY